MAILSLLEFPARLYQRHRGFWRRAILAAGWTLLYTWTSDAIYHHVGLGGIPSQWQAVIAAFVFLGNGFHFGRSAAQQGHAKAQVNLGALYQDGQGVERDFTEAVQWYRRAAAQGSAKGQYALAVMYRKGLGVPRDYVRAHMWYDLAAAQNLGIAGQERDAVARNMTSLEVNEAKTLATRWWRKHQTPDAAR